MRITVRIKPNAKENEIKQEDATYYSVRLNAPSAEGKANIALIKLLADYFGIAQSRIVIVSGFSSRAKIIEII